MEHDENEMAGRDEDEAEEPELHQNNAPDEPPRTRPDASLLDGDFDEEENRRSFLEALNQWRTDGGAAAEEAEEEFDGIGMVLLREGASHLSQIASYASKTCTLCRRRCRVACIRATTAPSSRHRRRGARARR